MNNDKMEHIIFGLQCENNELKLKNIMLEAELNKLKETYTCDYRRDSWKNKFFKAQEEVERLTRELNDTVSMNEMYIKKVEETAELQKQVDKLENRFENKACCNMSENCSMIQQAVKDTAEKFAERVKMAFYYEFDELIPSIMSDKIDEICKEITEGD